MDLEDFRRYWKILWLSPDMGEDEPLTDFLKECLGEHKGGLLFQGKGREEGNLLVLKCEDRECLRKNGDDWENIGFLYDPEGRV